MESKAGRYCFPAFAFMTALGIAACQNSSTTNSASQTDGAVADTLVATVVTEAVAHDSDDPAIWVNPRQADSSLVLGTDKNSDGALYAFDLKGKIVNKVTGLKRPNNVDIAYGLNIGGKKVDIAVLTERETNSIRVYSLPDLTAIDGGGIPVFEGEDERAPMGVALYTRPQDSTIFAIVGRKSGPTEGYLWQYSLSDAGNGHVKGELVRKFGAYSGKKEIESIAVDNEAGYIYYSDEQTGVRKYLADPDARNNEELALFAQEGFKEDHEGIAIYKTGNGTGYLLVSNQGAQTFMVYPREGDKGNPNAYTLIAEIPVSAMETDGADVTSVSLGADYPQGLFVAMSTDRTFHFFDWRKVQEYIDRSAKDISN